MKIVFDASIHLAQFDTSDEKMRVAAKNSQVRISTKPDAELIGIVSFNENSYCDDIIWSLQRDTQDAFYRYMDNYHSLKHIVRVPLEISDLDLARTLHSEQGLHVSNALTCAIAINHQAQEVHSFYLDFSRESIRSQLLLNYGIRIWTPRTEEETSYAESGLENHYQEALRMISASQIFFSERFHS